jgi:hypothetical protein
LLVADPEALEGLRAFDPSMYSGPTASSPRWFYKDTSLCAFQRFDKKPDGISNVNIRNNIDKDLHKRPWRTWFRSYSLFDCFRRKSNLTKLGELGVKFGGKRSVMVVS